MSKIDNKDFRAYVGSGIILISIVALLFFLAFFEIPDSNNDIFKVILGVLLGSLPSTISAFIGRDSDELEKIKHSNARLSRENEALKKQVDKLEGMVRSLQERVINKISDLREK